LSSSINRVASSLQSAYNEQYGDEMTEWRELGAKFKAANILKLCAGRRFDKVLECGAGEGSILKWLDKSGAFRELSAVEISDSGIEQIQKRNLPGLREVKKFNGYEIPYADGEFDLVYCSHVLEHVEHPRILLREIKRVGRFQAFEVPLDYSTQVDELVRHYLSYGHINIFTPSLFKFLLKSEGFEILEELRARMDPEVTRHIWYKNMRLKKTFRRELSLRLGPLRDWIRKKRMGEARHNEFAHANYCCLTRGAGELKIF
jgi:ubiquinone/menaquinone biosynthesis C-methylase UbiE